MSPPARASPCSTGTRAGAWRRVFTPDGREVLSTGADGVLREWDARSGRQLLAIPSLGSGAVASNGAGLVTVGNDDQQTGAVVDLAPRGRARSGGHVPGRHRLEHPRRRQWRRRRANDVWRRERRLGHDLPPRHRRWRHAADGARPRGEHAGNGAGRHTVRRPRRQRRRERRDDGARPAHRRCPRAARSSRGCTLDAAAALVAGQRTDRRRHGHCVGGVGRRHGRARCTPPMRAATAWSSSTRSSPPTRRRSWRPRTTAASCLAMSGAGACGPSGHKASPAGSRLALLGYSADGSRLLAVGGYQWNAGGALGVARRPEVRSGSRR